MLVPKAAGAESESLSPSRSRRTAKSKIEGRGALEIERAQENGKVLVCCALGMQRSAAAVAVWLVSAGHAKSGEEAIGILRGIGRPIHLDAALIEAAIEERR